MTTTEQPPPPAEETSLDEPSEPQLVARHKHSLGLRWMHWINAAVMPIMIYTGMRIYWADLRDPYTFGIGGLEIFTFWPDGVYSALDIERRLAKGIAWHLTFGWIFVLNGIAYTVHLARKGNWRRLVPDRRGVRDVPETLLHDMHLRKDAPPQGKYNAVQQLTYAGVWVMALLLVLSGFAIYKPTQLAPLTWILGGYQSARFIHFSMAILFLVFIIVHVIQVIRSGRRNAASIVTGYRVEPARDSEELDNPEEVSPT